MLAGLALAVVVKPSVGQQTAPDPAVWTVPEIGALPNDATVAWCAAAAI